MPSTNLAQILAAAAVAHGECPAIVAPGGVTTTYAQLGRRAAATAAGLGRHGITPGDRVGLHLPNGPEFVAAYHGVLAAGAIVVPLNPLLAPPEIAQRLRASGARLVIGAAAGGSDVAVVGPDVLAGSRSSPDISQRGGDDPAVILFTSGTTGTAKGAVLTHAGLLQAARNAVSVLGYGADDVILGSAPFSHVLGASGGMNAAILAGAALVVPERFDAPRTLAEITATGTTVLLGVPTMCVALTAAAREVAGRPPLRLAHVGGAPLPAQVRLEFERTFGCPVHEGYGLTELTGMAAAQPVGVPRTEGSVGVPVGGVEMRIRAADGSICAAGEIGEIQFRGGTVFPGYWQDPAATAAAFDAGGWLATGDLGRADEGGNIHLVDRTKDVIIRGGYNVYPREVEEALHQHPAVREVAVVGTPHDILGEEVTAYVVLEPGARADADTLRAFAAQRVAAYKYPRRVVVCESLPKSPTGKVLKRELARTPVD